MGRCGDGGGGTHRLPSIVPNARGLTGCTKELFWEEREFVRTDADMVLFFYWRCNYDLNYTWEACAMHVKLSRIFHHGTVGFQGVSPCKGGQEKKHWLYITSPLPSACQVASEARKAAAASSLLAVGPEESASSCAKSF